MYNFKEVEEEIFKFWKAKKIYEKVKSKNKNGKKFYFLQGPPYTSGKIHIGHAWNNSLKDIIMRYKRMQGFNVWDRAGYDMHGLPTENAVQKKLKLKTKEEIVKMGVDKFVKECMAFSKEYSEYMNEDLAKLGIWMDYPNAYKPIEKEFISGEWKFFKEAWKQNRLYKGFKVMHWDAETETSVAKHELEYEMIKDTSIFLKFKKQGTKNEYFVIWTTTPWTIPYNLAVMVNPDVKYVKIKIKDEFFIVAKDLVEEFGKILGKEYKIVYEILGKKLEGEEYIHPLYDELKSQYDALKKEFPKVHTVILSKEFVDTTSGTGMVHCAPGCGPEDQEAAEPYGIGVFNTLNEQGSFEDMGKYSGWIAKKDDNKFIQEFKDKGILIATKEVKHEYPHSWRSHKPVVFRTTEQWFLKTKDLAKQLLKMNENVNWVPDKCKTNYNRWTENLRDNSVTRQRFWGCPVPIWVNEKDPEDYFVVGGTEELEKLTKKKFNDLNLHKPWIDKIIIEKNGKKYKRIPDVADVWIDSGTASWNCLYNDEKLIKEWFPADLVLEATEQTRLWFSLLQICSAIVMKKSSYKNVYCTGMILDYQGTKMSKSLGNIISPYEVIEKFGADVLRYYICQITAGENISFSWEDIKVKQRNLNILSNLSNLILDIKKQTKPKKSLDFEEKYILSRKNSVIKKVTKLVEEYRLDEIIKEIEELFLDLSRVYIRLTREKTNGKDAGSVLYVLEEVYSDVLKMFSIICPFISDKLYRETFGKESVHLESWPKINPKMIDEKLEKEIEDVLKVIEVGLRERDKIHIGLKWPLAKAEISGEEIDKELIEIIKSQLNVKSISMKKSKEITVKFDTKITPELESEGYAREISRQIQSFRKKLGLEKKDKVEVFLSVDKELKDILEPQKEFIKGRTNSKKLVIFIEGVTTIKERFKNKTDFKVKDKKGVIGVK